MRPIARLALIAVLSVAAVLTQTTSTPAQSKPVLRVEDSGRWESLVLSSSRLGLSPDGSVIAYRVDRSNWEDELRVTRVADGRTLVVPYGRDPEYSADGRWLKYTVGHSQETEDQLRRDRRPVHDGLGLLQLDTFVETRFSDVESASFSADGAFVAMERYSARGVGRTGGARRAADADTPRLYVRALAAPASAELAFDNVKSYDWQPDQGHALAMVMSGDGSGGARVQLVQPSATAAATTVVLDDSPATFNRLTWRPGGVDLAFLRSASASAGDRMAFDLVVVRNVTAAARQTQVFDGARGAGVTADTRVTDYRALAWSTDGRTVFVGVADNTRAAIGDTTTADVRIWHWSDVEVMPRQVENVDAARRRNRLAAINLDDRRLVPIALSLTSRATTIDGTSLAWVADWTPYALARTLGRPSADLSLVDYRTGQREVFATNVDDNDVHARPGGGALVFLRDGHLWSLNTTTRALTDLSIASGAALVDVDADTTAAHKPLFGIGGWTSDGALLAYDRFDIWRIAPDGSAATKLTDGAATRTRHRLALMNDEEADAPIDMTQPVYIALFGERTKQFGYARLTAGRPLERLIFQDKRIDHLTTSARGNVFAYTAQAFDDAPDIFLGGATLANARAVTSINPQQSQYAWGTSAVIDYTTARGDALQAALYYPAGYVAGRRYPTIVTLYERLSDEVHDYVPPSDMDEANISVFTNLGYVVIAPDIRYRPRDPGVSTVDGVTAAVARAVALGITDPARVGVIGHSWGAYGSAYLATHTTGVFAAAVAGAPITDLISQYGNHHWDTGVAETDHIETGQQRMQVPFYEDVDAYVRNSPIFGVPKMTTPLLLEAGDADGDVFWHQSVELYNAARRAQKPVVLLQYPDEEHVLDDFDNRRDYQRRILQWFGHFLKSETAPQWITTGTPYVKR